MGDDDRRGRDAIICKRHGAVDIEFEAILSLVVADGGHAANPGLFYLLLTFRDVNPAMQTGDEGELARRQGG
jgi:hypothetical protein